MRAAFFRDHGGPEVLEVGEAPEPVAAHGDVIVGVRAVALNHLDLWVRRGIPGLELELPHIGGSDVAGVVEATGAGVEGWEPGDRVVANPALWCGECEACDRGQEPLCHSFAILGEHVRGGTAERVRVPATNLFRIPDGLDFPVVAAAPLVFQTAWRALASRARLAAGETLLVTGGSGGVSTAAIQIGRHLGARVLVLTSGTENVRRVEELGADAAIDRLAADLVPETRRLTDGRGVDVVLDSVGEALWSDCLRCLAPAGRLVTYGATTGPAARLDIRHVFWKQLSVIGTTMAARREFEEVMALVADGALRPVVDDVLPLDRIREAHERLEAGGVFGKLVLVP
ncbi:MAG: zinc-binding dehydrogenase [Gemmatimonadota bacterium]|nr:zinc-binding dehydrogenase [Gemmatimonadota bacterium]